MYPSIAEPSQYFSIKSLFLGPRISEEEKSITPFFLQYEQGATQQSNVGLPTHIRLVIVRDVMFRDIEEDISDLILESWIEETDRGRVEPMVRYRDILRYRKATSTRHFVGGEKINPSSSRSYQKPSKKTEVLTVIFEAAYMNEERIGFVYYPEQRKPEHAPAILLDCTFPLPDTSYTATIYVQSSIPTIIFHGLSPAWDAELKHSDYSSWSLDHGLETYPSVVHLLTIKPIARDSTHHSPSLPLNILRQIALEIIKYRAPGWRLQLLQLGLVNKAWMHLLDLFFELHTCDYSLSGGNYGASFNLEENGMRPPQLIRFAQSLLNGRPGRALLLKTFDLSFYADTPHGGFFSRHVHDRPTILNATACVIAHARFLKDITIDISDFLDHKGIRSALYNLADIETCIAFPALKSGGNGADATLESMQQILCQWKNLKIFHWSGGWHSGKLRSGTDTSVPDLEAKLGDRLEELSIRTDTVGRLEFLEFFVASPRLSRLLLEEVYGLQNQDLYDALAMVTAIISGIRINGCPISKGPDEEHALDALVAKMKNLEHLEVSPDVFSSLALERRKEYTSRAELVVLDLNDPFFLNNFGKAIKASGSAWRSIFIRLGEGFPYAAKNRIEEIKRIAKECGTQFGSFSESWSRPTIESLMGGRRFHVPG